MTKSKNINAPRHEWTTAELGQLGTLYPDQTAKVLAATLGVSASVVYAKANQLGLKKSDTFKASSASGRLNGVTGAQTRFQSGGRSWNKGMKGLQIGGEATQFKPGQRPHTWVPVGSYRVNGDGYLDQKITDDGPAYKHWEAVHRLVWKRTNGAIPPAHVVVFKPGRRSSVLELIAPDALECITRGELSRRNNPSSKSPELGRLNQLRGAITRQINRRLRATPTEGATS